jgi:hypothetical protein
MALSFDGWILQGNELFCQLIFRFITKKRFSINMSLTLQNLNNIRTLRAMAREFSIEALEEMLEKSGSLLKKNVTSWLNSNTTC